MEQFPSRLMHENKQLCVSLCELNLNELKMSETNRVDDFTLNTHF